MVPLSQCWMFILVHTMNKEVSASLWKIFDVCNQVPALKATNAAELKPLSPIFGVSPDTSNSSRDRSQLGGWLQPISRINARERGDGRVDSYV